jgi:Cu(I)/Ag(I) efflux system membrane fusion protein/cobalt-zinc-cadmium efflux system membrane fusion protein
MTKLLKRFCFLLALVLLLGGLLLGSKLGLWPAPSGGVIPSVAAATEHDHGADATQYTCGMHPMVIVDEPGSCPICGMDLIPLKTTGGGTGNTSEPGERAIKYWVAPMDPTYIRDEPGKSPMGMDLVPVYEDEAAGGSMITIDAATTQNMGVRTAPVRRQDLARTISTVGLVAYPEPEQYAINSKVGGWIEKLHVNETGQRVEKGQTLLEIYSPDLVSAQEEFLLALKNRDALAQSSFPQIAESGRQLLQASRRRLQLWDISAAQIERLEKTHQVEKTLKLYAPHSGVVSMKMIQEGQFAKPGMDLLTISDISRVWVQADIYEYELPWVEVGQQADIILPFVGSKQVSATLDYIYPYLEPQTRTVKARFVLENPDFELKPDMYVKVQLQTNPVKNALTIPAEAVLYSGETTTVFVQRGAGKFEPRRVKTGVQDDQGNLQIVQGLLAGETVVTSAQFMLDSESKLREAIAKMREPQAAEQKPQPRAEGEADLTDLFSDETDADQSLEALFE